MAVAGILFAVGLIPSYVSVLIVEKHYTAFWTGFWNLYGICVTILGLAIDYASPLALWILFVFALIFGIVFYLAAFANDKSDLVRRWGASWIATSINWGFFVGFVEGPGWGILVAIVHGLVMLGIAALFESL